MSLLMRPTIAFAAVRMPARYMPSKEGVEAAKREARKQGALEPENAAIAAESLAKQDTGHEETAA